MSAGETVVIDTLGGRGDGIAETDTGRVFVPYTLAGETVDIVRDGSRGKLSRIRRSSADRIAQMPIGRTEQHERLARGYPPRFDRGGYWW